MKKQLQPTPFLLYKSENGNIKVDVLVENETVWLTHFATVQNKLHWAIVGETAAEIIYHRVDSDKHNEVLKHKGKISHEVAVTLALEEYEKYRVIQDRNHISDFDKLLLDRDNQ